MSEDWRGGLRLLEARVAQLPAVVRAEAAAEEPRLAFDPRAVRRIVTTGVGSSAAHARFLAHLLADLGLDARAAPVTGLAPAERDVLVVFSQGLSPNGRYALADASRWHHVVVATAVDAPRLGSAVGGVLRFTGADECGVLVRVIGPMAGYLAAYRWAAAVGRTLGRALPRPDGELLAARVAAALADPTLPPIDATSLAFVTSGAYGELALNLQYKVLEGMLRPLPPVWDVLALAHGPVQQAFAEPATFVALARADAAGEAELLARAEALLAPERHRLVRLTATVPGPLAILEHEAWLDALLLRELAARHVDQVRWPGRGTEMPLYALERPPLRRALATMTWRELEAALAGGCRTAVVALGSIEQHGPHLPLATDAWIADALLERVCARLDDAIAVPTVPVGCASEHLDFPGTLDLREATLSMLLTDVLASLGRHGFERAFVFSAHGGNCAPLARAAPALAAACAPLELVVFTDLEALTAALQEAGSAAGVRPAAAGHHAGELETSILLALRPHAVRTAELAPGLAAPAADAQALFYPSLRANAPSGTVGDPRAADAARGARYLDVWADVLVDAYRGAKKRTHANGTQKA